MQDLFYQGKFIRVETHNGGIQKLLLARPETRNAFHAQMIAEINAALNQLMQIEDVSRVRLLVIAAEGKIFSSGADLTYMQTQGKKSMEENLFDAKCLADMFYNLASFPTPILCIVQGMAIGGAMGVLSCADYVLCEEKALFSTSEVLLGLVPANISPYLIRKIGLSQASVLMLSGQKITAQYAKEIGLVHNIVQADQLQEFTLKITKQFLQAAPQATRATKALIQRYAELPKDDLIELCAQQIAAARSTAEAREGIESFFLKKNPNWCM